MPLVYAGRPATAQADEALERARKVKPQYLGGKLVRVAGARNLAETQLIQGILLEEGIPSVERRTRGFDVPDFLAAGPRDVLVPEAAYDDARALLADPDAEPIAELAPSAFAEPPLRLLAKMGVALVAAAALVWVLWHAGQAAGAVRSRPALANGCFALASADSGRLVAVQPGGTYAANRRARAHAAAFYLKPTGLGAYMLQDRSGRLLGVDSMHRVARIGAPGHAAEWTIRRSSGHSFSMASTAEKRAVVVHPASGDLALAPGGSGSPFEFLRDRGCRRFPEAKVNATGRPFQGTRPDGTVLGFADYHLHITADMRAGGQTVYGRNFARFGIAQALGHDAVAHGPDGALDVTGNLLRSGSPAGTHDTHGWPTFTGWPVHDTYTHQQTYYMWLKRAWKAGERMVVAQMVEDQPLCELEQFRTHSCDEMQTVKLEIRRLRALQRYVDAQSGGRGRGWFRIVGNPRQARRVIEQGKLAVVIGMEASDPFGCSELLGQPQCSRADIDRGLRALHAMGLRSMFITHWIDNAFGGAALEPGANGDFIAAMQVRQTGQPFTSQPCPGADEAAGQCNVKGLTGLGRYLVRRLLAKHMLIETDHLSQKGRATVLAMAEAHHYPLISSHTGTGGAWTPAQLRRLYRLGGLATATLATAPELAAKINRLRRYQSGDFYFGVGLGSDTGGFNALPGPSSDAASHPLRYPFKAAYCPLVFHRETTGRRVYDLNKDGVAQYGLVADLIAGTRQEQGGRAAVRTLFRSAEAYLEMWGRAYRRP
jgi:microsomal dipeptidase-like Zn-dependent dipeptidase